LRITVFKELDPKIKRIDTNKLRILNLLYYEREENHNNRGRHNYHCSEDCNRNKV
jgi:hypothetical protein